MLYERIKWSFNDFHKKPQGLPLHKTLFTNIMLNSINTKKAYCCLLILCIILSIFILVLLIWLLVLLSDTKKRTTTNVGDLYLYWFFSWDFNDPQAIKYEVHNWKWSKVECRIAVVKDRFSVDNQTKTCKTFVMWLTKLQLMAIKKDKILQKIVYYFYCDRNSF